MTEQPEALRLAAALKSGVINEGGLLFKAAAELRRLHAENEELSRVVEITASLNRKLMEEIERSTAQHLTDTTRVVELEAEVESLRAENEQHRAAQAAIYTALGTDNPDRGAWPGMIESLRADAARYRWMKRSRVEESTDGTLSIYFVCDFENWNDVDAAIDATMRGEA